ncbi:MAG: rod shape-determining protein MreC [Alphaproteobacteria bacterium]|nr:rod shape-determining protein MreC [Alphaproteobacteria bacterium]
MPAQRILRGSAFFCCLLTATVLITGHTHPAAVSAARAAAADALSPLLAALSSPLEAMRRGGRWLEEMSRLYEENQALKAQVARLSETQAGLRELKAENEALRQLLPLVPPGQPHYIAARIVGESGGPFVRAALVSAGSIDGVVPGQAVIGGGGLVGRVVEPGTLASRVLLLTDINSRVPVVGEMSGERAIASGNNTGQLSLEYVRAGHSLTAGERLLTSGEGGMFPPGVPVGVVADLTEGKVLAEPSADMNALDYVNIAQYIF